MYETRNGVVVRYIAYYNENKNFVLKDSGQSNEIFMQQFSEMSCGLPMLNLGIYRNYQDAKKRINEFEQFTFNPNKTNGNKI